MRGIFYGGVTLLVLAWLWDFALLGIASISPYLVGPLDNSMKVFLTGAFIAWLYQRLD